MKMTIREQDVFKLLTQGKTNKQIAAQLNISDFTVRDHVSALLRKKNVSSRMELIAAYHAGPGNQDEKPLHL
ncbi:response regulator transcription factor [Marinobacter sp. 1-4A]|uniref:response regulator transcription factor n=1 Tax=Marinobacter sp. 1-4A TaxID=2582919 RepID=UPI00190575F3|nr:LuxR C-terminal-related transcriptional regulator [Marinobacter sp. 1-4A]MBK1850550.1 response regulator transcription factor [Marinobacter sp. 1-4A]